MKLLKYIKPDRLFILLLFISLGTILPFFRKGFFQIHDDVQVARVFEMTKALSAGAFPVRWVEDLGYGAGYPLFNFYSVLPYYIGGFLALLGFDALSATKIVFAMGAILAGVSMYFFVKNFLGKIPGLAAAVVYLYFPYHALNIYVRGDLAELFAYIFIPLVFLALLSIFNSEKISKANIVLGSLSIAAVVISHNLSAFMLFIFVGLFVAAALIIGKNKKNLLLSFSLVLVLAFLLSAFYAVPALLEMKYTNVMTQVGGGSDYRNHFVCLTQLWDSPWGFAGSAPGCIEGISFKLGKSNIIFAAFGVIAAFAFFAKVKKMSAILITSVAFLIFSLFMTLEYSSFLWRLPFMDFLQFPWRFLNYSGLFISVLVGFLVWVVSEKKNARVGLALAILIIFVTIYLNAKLFWPQRNLTTSVADYTHKHYLTWTASKISDEYMPKGFITPRREQEVSRSLKNARAEGLYKKIGAGSTYKFDTTPTFVQQASNMLSVVGVLALIAVIIKKPVTRKHG